MPDTLSDVTSFSQNLPPLGQAVVQRFPLATVWRLLASGQLRILQTQLLLGRCLVVVRNQTATTSPPPLAIQVAERVLAGEQPKVVASELRISQATVCLYCRSVLQTFSDSGPMSRASTFAVMCACAARGIPVEAAVVHGVNQQGNAILSVQLPDALLERAGLSEAERRVAWARIQGKSAAEICAERKTSLRTIANQLNSIHRKLRVSGRRELLAAVLTYAAQ
jgi:DNA-binding CsgD family transcriptional regulator